MNFQLDANNKFNPYKKNIEPIVSNISQVYLITYCITYEQKEKVSFRVAFILKLVVYVFRNIC